MDKREYSNEDIVNAFTFFMRRAVRRLVIDYVRRIRANRIIEVSFDECVDVQMSLSSSIDDDIFCLLEIKNYVLKYSYTITNQEIKIIKIVIWGQNFCPLCFYIFVNCKNKQKYLLLFVRIIPILILHTTRCCDIIKSLYKIYAFKELKDTLYI